jgi:hypothetical protein
MLPELKITLHLGPLDKLDPSVSSELGFIGTRLAGEKKWVQ